jgi:DNA-binding winged helix-turn-helix (wHTH) protein
MLFLSISHKSLHAVYVMSSFFGKKQTVVYNKTLTTSLINDGTFDNETLQEALKEMRNKLGITGQKKVDTITTLPTNLFWFSRLSIPKKMGTKEIAKHLQEHIKESCKDYEQYIFTNWLTSKDDEQVVHIYGIQESNYQAFKQALQTSNILLEELYPSSAAQFALIEKTVTTKDDIIVFASAQYDCLEVNVFDSLGKVSTKADTHIYNYELEDAIKDVVQKLVKTGSKPSRIILSGENSNGVRQDLFTKNVGAWVNLYKKIAPNFYSNEMTAINGKDESEFPILTYDVPFGSYLMFGQDKEMIYEPLSKQLAKAAVVPKIIPDKKVPEIKEEVSNEEKEIKVDKVVAPEKPAHRIKTEDKAGFPIKPILLFLGIGLLVFGITFTVLPFLQPEEDQLSATPSPAIALPSPTIVPTTTPSYAKDKLSIVVRNGSGIKGKAQKISSILVQKGYSKPIATNADSFNYTTSVVKVKNSLTGLANLLASDLSSLGVFTTAILPEASSADVEITFGSNIE